MKKVGIMGGTFDPIHNGHLIIAENAAWQFELDHIFFMPTGYSPHKDDRLISSSKHRCNMIGVAIDDNEKFSLSMHEIMSNEVNYTFQTLESLKQEYPQTEFYFVLGADSLFNLEQWAKPERILKACHILVAVRDELNAVKIKDKMTEIKEKYNASIFQLETPTFDVSSHNIRERVKQNQTIRYMVPNEVKEYIENNNLYRF